MEFAEQGGRKLNFGQQLLLLRELKKKREIEDTMKRNQKRARKSKANEFKSAVTDGHDPIISSMCSSDSEEEENTLSCK